MIIEKPFGYDKESAVALNAMLAETFKKNRSTELTTI
jgi:glucose-6-phosphate 1-dehydrogenase